ncbi:MAG: translational GTPase TypA [SAR202 cluster bacterium]|nr:translational GTPase TypA [SAR202 cluster bacterium]|tara:strand:- start:332 stop:2155 length:1824 start_codon:yes stop_codon:yes gene_type:complete
MTTKNIRNLAIIAHVDHGKTTLVDALIKQGLSSQKNQKLGDLIMDSNPLERERGITILAKNTAVSYKGTKINIIDTPGHADFSGEVERIMNMADGCLLVVDAVDGPMPQTYYVLKQALEQNVKPIVVINKIDRTESRVDEVIEMVQDLFLELATKSEDLDFPILFASAKENYCINSIDSAKTNMEPLLDNILENIPPPNVEDNKPFQMLVAALDFDNYLGQIAIGRIFSGNIKQKQQVTLLRTNGENQNYTVEKLFVFQELSKTEVTEVQSGEIVAISGIENVSIGDTISSPDFHIPLPKINIEEPTVKMTFGVNTSPFMGMEGKQCTSRMLHDRLMKELRTNISLKVEKTNSPDSFLVSGRGELQLAILVESLRREEFEFQVSRPEPVLKEIDGVLCEPYEKLIINTSEDFIGVLNENLSSRLAELTNMTHDGSGNVKLEFDIPTRGLIGFGSFFARTTRGNGTKDSFFNKFQPLKGIVHESTKGLLIASEKGTSVMFGLINAQGRGDTFIEPGTQVYEGMVIGMHNRDEDIPINVCKEKKLTNMRSSTADIAKRLSPPVKMSLEEALDFMSSDELLEATPKNFRLRKKELSSTIRQRKKNRTTNS